MEINGWDVNLSNLRRGLRHPTRPVDEILLDYLLRAPLTAINARWPIGTNVFDREWDILVLLDTCRVDALEAVRSEYEFIGNVGSIWSVGGSSPEWVARTFDADHAAEISRTAYLSANAHAQTILDERQQDDRSRHQTFRLLRSFPTVGIGDVGKVEYLFKYEPMGDGGPYGHEQGGTPPRYVTDRAISLARQQRYDRLLLHYFQPHSPWVATAIAEGRPLHPHEEGFGYLTETGDVESMWRAYLNDLRWVLDDVALLLENVDADRVVISADHGDAFGEFGIMSHKIGSIHPHIRRVPWVETSGKDEHTYTPSVSDPGRTKVEKDDINEQLAALGYRT